MWDVGNKTFAVENVMRVNRSASERINQSTPSPPRSSPIPPPAPSVDEPVVSKKEQKKRKGIIWKVIVAIIFLAIPSTVPNGPSKPDTSSSTASQKLDKKAVELNEDNSIVIPDSWRKTLEVLSTPTQSANEKLDSETPPVIQGKPITIREFYLTPPLLHHPVFDVVGD